MSSFICFILSGFPVEIGASLFAAHRDNSQGAEQGDPAAGSALGYFGGFPEFFGSKGRGKSRRQQQPEIVGLREKIFCGDLLGNPVTAAGTSFSVPAPAVQIAIFRHVDHHQADGQVLACLLYTSGPEYR